MERFVSGWAQLTMTNSFYNDDSGDDGEVHFDKCGQWQMFACTVAFPIDVTYCFL